MKKFNSFCPKNCRQKIIF